MLKKNKNRKTGIYNKLFHTHNRTSNHSWVIKIKYIFLPFSLHLSNLSSPRQNKRQTPTEKLLQVVVSMSVGKGDCALSWKKIITWQKIHKRYDIQKKTKRIIEALLHCREAPALKIFAEKCHDLSLILVKIIRA